MTPDAAQPDILVQGTVRSRNQNGDRLVTLFLVNAQNDPSENKDSAWVFQPELAVRAVDDAEEKAIFRRRAPASSKEDEERRALEMIYRQQVEFAVGHGVSVHAKVDAVNPEPRSARPLQSTISTTADPVPGRGASETGNLRNLMSSPSFHKPLERSSLRH